jgi:hypothetical protein
VVFAEQQGIGLLLDLWPRTASGGWDPAGYSLALALSAGLQLVALAWLFLKRDDQPG